MWQIGINRAYVTEMSTTTAIAFITLLAILRLYIILPSKQYSRTPRPSAHACTIAVFLGSGTYFTLLFIPDIDP